jgi:hypothetical protein
MNKIIFEKTYNWESSYDLERDISEAIEETTEIEGGEWPGTIKITIEYDSNNEE